MTAAPQSQVPAHAPGRRVPDFFIVGHPKSGTTALYDMLKRHPGIYMPPVKEPWYFADELQPPTPPRPMGHGSTPGTLEEYLSLFDAAAPQQRAGEASTVYLWSRTAAGRIADVQPAARIIAVLREPASFLRSLHLQLVQSYLEPEKDLRKAISLERARRQGGDASSNSHWPGSTLYSEHVRYVEQLRRYHALFPPEQVLVLIYDDFRRDNEATVRKVQRFLGVDDTQPLAEREANRTVRVRSPRLHALLHTAAAGEGPALRALRSAVKALAPRALSRESAVAIRDRIIFSNPRPPDESLMIELRRRFAPEVVALSEYLDRDLTTLWGYDRLG
ncbi:MAG: sulfotransferase [Solirubrobacteraceae bacterium]|jgi:hypothetical protein